MLLITSVIKNPIVTEKTVANTGSYSFSVNPLATKLEIAKAVEQFYGVEVKKVQTEFLPPKKRLVARGRQVQKRGRLKKATVTLKDNATLDFNAFK